MSVLKNRHSGVRRNPVRRVVWTPAFAGVTGWLYVGVKEPSFRRRPESSAAGELDPVLRRGDGFGDDSSYVDFLHASDLL